MFILDSGMCKEKYSLNLNALVYWNALLECPAVKVFENHLLGLSRLSVLVKIRSVKRCPTISIEIRVNKSASRWYNTILGFWFGTTAA